MEKISGLKERDWLYALSQIPGIGRKTIHTIMEQWGTIAAFAAASRTQGELPLMIERKLREKIGQHLHPEQVVQAKIERMNRGIRFICIHDSAYPESLRHIADTPLLLYYRGDLTLLQQPIIAVVGSRKPTPYGRSACMEITRQLVEAGMIVASGVAYGIDAEAHRTALRHNGGTIGVLGCGIDQVYPSSNRPLYHEMEEKGLILSEYPPGTQPLPGFFPERNRIISGISLGVVIIEAALKSGSLITAQFALEQGREVFAVPGPIFSHLSAGPHNLIQEGAKLVTGWEDIRSELMIMTPDVPKAWNETAEETALSESERLLLEQIGYQPIHWDELFAVMDPDIRKTMDRDLLQLEGKGYLSGLPGGYYTRRK